MKAADRPLERESGWLPPVRMKSSVLLTTRGVCLFGVGEFGRRTDGLSVVVGRMH